jgi:hypothetical protein
VTGYGAGRPSGRSSSPSSGKIVSPLHVAQTDSGTHPSSCLYLKGRPVSLSKLNVSETGFCLRLQVRPTQLGPVSRADPNVYLGLRMVVML